MAKAPSVYFLKSDEEANEILHTVINGFDRFQHIKESEILLIYKVAAKNRFAAETRKISKLYSVLAPGKKIIITIFRPQWEIFNRPQKIAVMYHELCHIGFDEEKEEYKMIRHDVEDFKELIDKLGFNYEKALDLMKEMKPVLSPEAVSTLE